MILTGKALEDFLKTQGVDEDTFIEFNFPREVESLIIEWFDSVGIVLEISTLYYDGWNFVATMSLPNGERLIPNIIEESRQEATRQAIIKANEIYNSKF